MPRSVGRTCAVQCRRREKARDFRFRKFRPFYRRERFRLPRIGLCNRLDGQASQMDTRNQDRGRRADWPSELRPSAGGTFGASGQRSTRIAFSWSRPVQRCTCCWRFFHFWRRSFLSTALSLIQDHRRANFLPRRPDAKGELTWSRTSCAHLPRRTAKP
jgi:hypothetical protein